MKKQTAVIAAIAFAIVLAACYKGERQVTLRMSFPEDTQLKYLQISKRNYSVIKKDSVLAQRKMIDTLQLELEFIRMVDDTTYEIMERGTIHRSVPCQEDSTKSESVTLTTETLLRVLPNGKIQSFDIIDNGLTRAESYVEDYYEQGSPVFPAGGKPVGYSWTQSTKVVIPDETIEASTTYTIKTLVRQYGYDCALIEYQGNMAIPIVPSPSDSVQRSGVDLITTEGLLYFAHKEGRVIEQTENWKIEGSRHAVLPDSTSEDYKVIQDYSVSYRLVAVETKP